MTKPEFIDVFGTRCAILPVTEENVIAAAGIIFNRAPAGKQIKIGAIAKVYVVSRAGLEACDSIDDHSLVALHFEVSYGSYPLGKSDLFISKKPKLPWEEVQKLVIVIPEPKPAAPTLILPPGTKPQ